MALIEQCMEDATIHVPLPGWKWVSRTDIHLDPVPDEIKDKFPSVLGSAFHASHRINTPMHHCCKKAFFVVLSEAIYAWNKNDMSTFVERLKTKLKLTEDEVKSWQYFKRRYFPVKSKVYVYLHHDYIRG